MMTCNVWRHTDKRSIRSRFRRPDSPVLSAARKRQHRADYTVDGPARLLQPDHHSAHLHLHTFYMAYSEGLPAPA
jgi:hypothetical protein